MDSDDEVLDPCQAELANLVARAERGDDAHAVAGLQRFLVRHPQVWERCADLGQKLIHLFVDRIAQGDALLQQSLLVKVGQLQAEHAGPTPTPLERLLVERVVIGWLQLEQITGLVAQVDGLQQQAGWFIFKRHNRAHRQFLNAIETLAHVRRLQQYVVGPTT